MPVLFVLCETGIQHGGSIATVLRKCGETLPVSEHSYVVKTDLCADRVYDKLRSRIGKGALWVFTVPEPYTGPAPASVKLWLEEAGSGYVPRRDPIAAHLPRRETSAHR